MKSRLSGWIAVLAASASAVYCSGCGDKPQPVEAPVEPVSVEKALPIDVSVAAPVPAAFTGEVSVVIDKTIEIKRAEVDEIAEAMFSSNAGMIPPEQAAAARASIRKDAIRQLTLQALLKRECEKTGVDVTAEEVDAFFAKASAGRGAVSRRRPSPRRTRVGGGSSPTRAEAAISTRAFRSPASQASRNFLRQGSGSATRATASTASPTS